MAIGTIAALAIGGGLLGSAALSSSAAKKAGNTVAASTDRAAELQNSQFQQTLALQMPGYQRAEGAAGVYGQALGLPSMTGGAGYSGGAGMMTGQQGIIDQVRNTPGYQGQLDTGLKAIDRAAPLVGGMYSGRRMKALNDYGQETFGSYYQDWLGKVGGIAGQSQAISSNIGAQGQANANNVGNLMVQGANAKASGMVNSANAWTGAIGTATGLYGGSQGWFGR